MWVVADLDDEYIAKMEDVLEVYERPYDPLQPVICVDEKPITLHAEVRPVTPAEPGRETRRDSEYKRCGTANVFCAVEPLAGRHFTFATPNRSGLEFAMVIAKLALAYPTHLRATGTGVVIGAGRGGAALAPILAGYLFGQGYSLQTVSIIMGCGSLVGAIALLFVKFESTSEAVPGGTVSPASRP